MVLPQGGDGAVTQVLEPPAQRREEVVIERIECLGSVVGELVRFEPAAEPLIEPLELAAERPVGIELFDPAVGLGDDL